MPQGCGCGTGGGGGGTGSCSDVASCVSGMVSGSNCLDVTGTSGNESLNIVISNQSGNLAQCTSNGLYVAGEVTPTFCNPPPLTAPFYLANFQGPYAPWGSKTYLDVLIDHRINGIWGYTWPAPDGPFIWGINSSGTTVSRYFQFNWNLREQQNLVDLSGRFGDIHSQTWTGLTSPAGNGTGLMPNTTNEITYDPGARDTTDGGWWGWGSSPYSPMTLRQALEYNACRLRFFTSMQGTTFHTGSSNIAERFIQEMSDSNYQGIVVPVLNWSLVGANTIYNNAGYETAAEITTSFTGTGQDLVNDGFTYVIANPDVISDDIYESVMTTEGLIGISNQTMSRHFRTANSFAAGAQGIISHDPIYSRGYTGSAADTYYEQPRLHYSYNRTIGSSTERGDVNTGNAYDGRPGRHLYLPPNTSTEASRQRELLFPLQIPDPTNYELNWTMSWNRSLLSSSTGQGIGIFFGNTQDSTTWGPRATSAELAALNGYFCTVTISLTDQRGYIYIIKYANGSGSELYRQNHNLTAASGGLQMGLQVSPSSFNFIAYNASWSPIANVTISDPDYRGKYVWGIEYSGLSQSAPIGGRFLNVNVGSPTVAALAALGADDQDEGESLNERPLVAPVDPNPTFNEPRPNPTPGM